MQDIFEFPQGAEQGTPGYLASSAMQRPNEKRDAAVRALIIYPMNALVEDQMTRLRDALDNDEVQRWMTERLHGNRIFLDVIMVLRQRLVIQSLEKQIGIVESIKVCCLL